MKKAYTAAAVAMVLLVGSAGHAQEKKEVTKEDGAVLGVLMCQTDPNNSGFNLLLASRRPVTCDYAGVGKPRTYEGTGGIIGLDLEYQMEDAMSYFVVGAGESADALLGTYYGVKATVRVGGGVSAQAGLAGVGNGILLVPAAIGGGVGAGFSGGVAYLQLTKVIDPIKYKPR